MDGQDGGDIMSELYKIGVVEAAEMIRVGDISAAELMEALLARCEAMDDALKVWVTLDGDAAMAAARERDRELANEGRGGRCMGCPWASRTYTSRGGC